MGGGCSGLGRIWRRGQGGCERRIEVFVKIPKKKKLGGGGGGCQGGGGRGRVWGVRVDVIEELKFLGKFTKKKFGWGGGGRVWGVNEELKFCENSKKKFGGGGGVGGRGRVGRGHGGCE